MVKQRGTGKERATLYLPKGLMNRARNTVFFTPGLSLSALTARALEAEVAKREKQHGGPFPQRTGESPSGRRIV